MQEIKQIVKDYLETPKTDYALMIKGDWGIGKTFFIKNTLKQYVEQIDSLVSDKKGNTKKCKPVYISLFGAMNSIDVLESIQLEINPILKSKPLQYGQFAFNKIGSLIGLNLSKGEMKDFVSTFNISKEYVLFFDDLERISKHADITNIIGQINQLTEHQNLKVMIVCNSKKADKLFSKTNEKTIRFSTLYQPDIRSIYDEIIKNYDAEYNPFLNDKKDFILKIFEAVSYNNLRTLRFILDIFQKVFQTTKPEKYKNEIIERFLLFLTIYSIENKDGNNIECLNKLKELGPWKINFDELLLPPGVPKKEEKEEGKSDEEKYLESISKKYKRYTEEYHYSHQLAMYVDTGYLDTEKLKIEIQEIEQELKRKEDSEETKTIKAIQNWREIKDDDFQTLISETLAKVESGVLSFTSYLQILAEFLIIERYQIDDFKVDEGVINKFRDGIDISKELHAFDNAFEIKLARWDERENTPLKVKFNNIRKYLIEANQSCGTQEKSSIKDQILDYIKNNYSVKLTGFHKEIEYSGEPFLADASPKLFFENIEKSDRTTQEAFNYFLRDRYYNIEDMIMKEQPFLEGLQIQIEDYFKEIPKKKINHIRLLEIKATIEFFLGKLIH